MAKYLDHFGFVSPRIHAYAASEKANISSDIYPTSTDVPECSKRLQIPEFPCNFAGVLCVRNFNMNANRLSTPLKIGIWVVISACNTSLSAATASTPQTLAGSAAGSGEIQTVAFKDKTEADLLRRAYRILATGDHDYKGHRVKAMRQIESAAGLLGLNLKGDLKDKQPQALSDAKLREARGLLQNVLGSAEVKSENRIAKHVNEAIAQINLALSIR